MLFIVAVIAVPFLSVIASITNQQSSTQTVYNESQNVSEANVGTLDINESVKFYVEYDYEKTGNEPTTIIEINNGTDVAPESSYDWNSSEGSWTINNESYWQNSGDTAYVTYEYKPVDYLESNFGRILVGLLAGFMALVVIVYMVSKIAGSDLWSINR